MNEIKYSNAVEVQLQLFDALLNFKCQNSEGIVDSTSIILSVQHLKVLSNLLQESIAQYEQQFGVISLPMNKKED